MPFCRTQKPSLGAVLTREGASGGVPIDGVTRVAVGCFGPDAISPAARGTAGDDGRKLCLVCEGRTVDLEIADAGTRQDWVRAFRWMLERQ
jgi:hypothetical protein